MHLLRAVCLLAVSYASPSGSKLDVTALQDFDIAHRVAAVVAFVSTAYYIYDINSLFELAVDHIREDLELAMSMSSKASLRLDAVFVDNTKRSKLFKVGMLVPAAIQNIYFAG